jgi:hypothetical protein
MEGVNEYGREGGRSKNRVKKQVIKKKGAIVRGKEACEKRKEVK